MYVCLCNGIRDSELKELGEKGVRNVEQAFRELDSEIVCSCCKDEAEEILTAANENRSPNLKLVAS